MNRAYYIATVNQFLSDEDSKIFGELSRNHTHALEDLQKNAWIDQIKILKSTLNNIKEGHIFFEFSIPRMGKRVDAILITGGLIFVLEFKVGSTTYEKYAIDQVMDYALDLKNFHEGSHHRQIVPILIATEAANVNNDINWDTDKLSNCVKANKYNLSKIIQEITGNNEFEPINAKQWIESVYKPTPTIVEAAQALYSGHNVQEISRSDSGATNLSLTANSVYDIISFSKQNNCKSICFITGVPGAGKTLAGLNIANNLMNHKQDEHAVFLSGNGPLVDVLREALARDEASKSKNITKSHAMSKVKCFIQNIHHFRDDGLSTDKAPIERVVIFDEAQRAWNKDQVCKFMKQKKGVTDFDFSEPEFLISVMDRHSDWSTIVCLIGGGQEINTGEAGLMEWFASLKRHFPHWHIFYSDQITDYEYTLGTDLSTYLSGLKHTSKHELHLSVSVRSFRSEKLSEFIHEIIDNKAEKAANVYSYLKDKYPIYLTRDIKIAKEWLKSKARGTERYGLISSSGAIRLKPEGINVKAQIDTPIWFLNDKDDIRSSYFLEDIATEFDVQGLELDWTCVCWDVNLRYVNNNWAHHRFSGSKWQNINDEQAKLYLVNCYRVLLTRARQGMIVFVPKGNAEDETRIPEYYDGVYTYLKNCGIEEI